jgi:hypothetical protein
MRNRKRRPTRKRRAALLNKWFEAKTARAALAGNTDDAYEILRSVAAAIDLKSKHTWKGPICWAHAQYIAAAFKKILDGKDAALALGTRNTKAGRRPGAGRTHNSEALAAAYSLLRLHDLVPKQAKLHLKQRTGAALRTIEKAKKEHPMYELQRETAIDRRISEKERDLAAELIKVGAKPYDAAIRDVLSAVQQRRKSR